MKKHLSLMTISFVILFFSCEKKEIKLFKDGHEIYFEKFFVNEMYPGTEEADSTSTSFFFYPESVKSIKVPLVVLLSGKLLDQDLTFGLKAVEEGTTAHAGEYTLDTCYRFKARNTAFDAGKVADTIMVQLNRSSRMESMEQPLRLIVELLPNEKVSLGQAERIRAKILFSVIASKPEWWNEEVENNLLGTYSQEKYRCFLNEIDKQAEMSLQLMHDAPDKAMALALKFKKWLSEQNPAILEEDGSLMEVKI